MAAQKLFVEVQDEQGNIYYVHTSSDVVFCADGETVEEKLKNATTEKDGRMSAEDKKKLDGIAEGANKYVHPTGSGNKHIPSGGSAGQVLRWSADGTAVWGADKDTTYTAFKAATSSAAGGAGLVPAPAAGNHDDYLRGDGKWGAASDMVQTFSQASSRTNITSGEANKTIFGKVMKWFADLGVSGIAAFAKVVNNGTTTVANTVLDGRFGKTLLDRIVAAEKNITTINSALVKVRTIENDNFDWTVIEYPSNLVRMWRYVNISATAKTNTIALPNVMKDTEYAVEIAPIFNGHLLQSAWSGDLNGADRRKQTSVQISVEGTDSESNIGVIVFITGYLKIT